MIEIILSQRMFETTSRRYIPVLFLIGCLLLSESCDTGGDRISFNEQIRPILNEHCLSCHGGVKQLGGFSLLFPEEALDTTESGAYAIVPGRRNHSGMYLRLLHEDPDRRMPQDAPPLSEAEIELIGRWIDQGAEWETHWAYQPLEQPDLPGNNDWARNDIDRYVWERLEEEGLEPAPEADPVTLLRRVSLDLTGLPPTVEEVEQFLNDGSPEAYEHAVDRLLDAPHYGEHWAALWLDLARYADSKGYEKDEGRSIWRFRDWVIDAFNEDMPFDQFTVEQIAGDLLPAEDGKRTADRLIATAFHRNTMTNTEGGTDDEEFRVAAVIDRVNTTFEVWQATTISCVQCHSHPYDPFRQEEFYELTAFFNNTVDSDTDADLPLLECFQPEDETTIAEVIDYIEGLDPERQIDRKALLTDQVRQAIFPNLLVSYADDFENTVFYGRDVAANWNNSVKVESGKRFFLKFDDIPLDDLEAITFDYWAGGEDGSFVVRLDERDGPVIARFDPPGTASPWTWQEYRSPAESASGKHDLLVELVNRTQRSPEGNLYLRRLKLHCRNAPQDPALAARQKELIDLRVRADYTPIMQEKTPAFRRKTKVFERGNWMVKGEEVGPAVPDVFPGLPDGAGPERLAFARWLVGPENPLTARVMVNRFWERIFGYGLVETLEDFGTQGEPPTHPELLDDLAWRFSRDYEWSVKRLLREIVLSATYRQASVVTAEKQEADPYNRLLSRGPRYRLSAEQLRDQALAVSGLLNDRVGGPSVMPPQPEGVWQIVYSGAEWKTDPDDRYRRGLYTYWKRTTPYPSMVAFDTPSREFCVSRRIRTNTPLQALVTLNDPVYVEAAQALARRMKEAGRADVEAAIRAGYRMALFQEPKPGTMEVLLALYDDSRDQLQAPRAQNTSASPDVEPGTSVEDPLTVVAGAILNLDAFLTKN